MIKTFITYDRGANPDEMVRQLSHFDPYKRHQARLAIEAMGESAMPTLMRAIQDTDWHVRWEVVKALGEIGDPRAVDALIDRLQDHETSVRWAAIGSLVRMGRDSVHPLMLRLTADFGSSRVREGVHHILRQLKDHGMLTEPEMQVFRALEGAAPSVQAAWAARSVLDGAPRS